MATKSNFTAAEWGRLLASPMVAGMAITAADPGGLWSLLKEGIAGVQSILEARRTPQASPLVKAVADDFATDEGARAAREAISGHFTSGQLEGLKDAALAELGAVSAMLDAKAPEDAAAFKAWLYEVAEK